MIRRFIKLLTEPRTYRSERYIKKWLSNHRVTGYTLVPSAQWGFIVNIEGSVDLSLQWGLTHIPVKFGVVNGDFCCSDNKLVSLKGCPEVVRGTFSCDRNRLTSLEFCPSLVEGEFYAAFNKINSLEFLPQSALSIDMRSNPSLGEYQDMTDLEELKFIVSAKSEERVLSLTLPNAKSSKSYKL